MTPPDFSGLSDLAKAPGRHLAGAWEPLKQADLGTGMIHFYDQSLTATGWVSVVSSPGLTQITGAGKFKTSEGTNSIETQLLRGTEIFSQARLLIGQHLDRGYTIGHESPPNPAQMKSKGGGISSMVSAQAIRDACATYDVVPLMLGAQPGKKLVCGSAKADKTEAHAALKTYFDWIEGSELVTNEATRDALIGALLYLYRQPKD